MSSARTGLEGQVVSIMRAIRERGRVESEALARRLEQERPAVGGKASDPLEARTHTPNRRRLAVPPAG